MANRSILMIEVSEILFRWCNGSGKKTIAKSLNIARNTIREIIQQAEGLGLKIGDGIEKIDSISLQLMDFRNKKNVRRGGIQADLKKRHEQLKAWVIEPYMTVPQMIRLFAERNFLVKETSLRVYIKNNFEKPDSGTVHLITIPGKQAQVDFGYVGMMMDSLSRKKRKAYAFVMTLSHSRYRFVRFVFRQDVATWIDCHIKSFNFFNGVPETILLDNLKAGVLKPDIYDPIINRTYAELERYYNFIVDPTKVRTPSHKGKVERSIPIIRQQLIAGRIYSDIQEANDYAIKWAREDISQKVTRTTGETPWNRFVRDEKKRLKSLPLNEFECPTWQPGKVHRDHHIVYNGSFYSVATKYIGKNIWIRATTRIFQCFLEGELIKTHTLATKKGEWITDPADYPESSRKFLDKTPEICIAESQSMGVYIYDLLNKIFAKTSITNVRKAQAILRLANDYGNERLNLACQRGLLFGNLEYKSIESILQKGLDLEAMNESHVESNLENLIKGSYLRNKEEFSSI